MVVFSSIIWYKASLASAQKAQQLKESCQESREGKSHLYFKPSPDRATNVLSCVCKTKFNVLLLFLWILLQYNMNKFNTKLCYALLLICVLPKTVTHTHRLSSLPSQCLLATASNPLHLSLVRGAGEAVSLVRSIPSLTARHIDRCKTNRCPSQQHLSQLPRSHWSVWLSLLTAAPPLLPLAL